MSSMPLLQYSCSSVFVVLPALLEHGVHGSMLDPVFINTILDLIKHHFPGVSVPLCAII